MHSHARARRPPSHPLLRFLAVDCVSVCMCLYPRRACVCVCCVITDRCDLILTKVCGNTSTGACSAPSKFFVYWLPPFRFPGERWTAVNGILGVFQTHFSAHVSFSIFVSCTQGRFLLLLHHYHNLDLRFLVNYFFSGLLKVCYFHRRRGHCSLDA